MLRRAVGLAVTGGSVAAAQNPEDALTVTLHVARGYASRRSDLMSLVVYPAEESRLC